jgi:hypothetical protein
MSYLQLQNSSPPILYTVAVVAVLVAVNVLLGTHKKHGYLLCLYVYVSECAHVCVWMHIYIYKEEPQKCLYFNIQNICFNNLLVIQI